MKEKQDLTEVVATGDRMAVLRAMCNVVAEEIERVRSGMTIGVQEAGLRDVVAGTKEISRLMVEIEEAGGGKADDDLDELSRRRATRRSDAAS